MDDENADILSRFALQCTDIHAGYGKVEVLHGVTVTVEKGEAVALLGHNGAGKTTLLRTMMGLMPGSQGELILFGAHSNLRRWSPQKMLKAGVAFVPQGAKVFPQLSVAENVEMGLRAAGKKVSDSKDVVEWIRDLIPMLNDKWELEANQLSGGQRQLVSVARAVVSSPRLLILDEPTIGLAPKMADVIMELLKTIQSQSEVSVLLVEQNVRLAVEFADRMYILKRGGIIHNGPTSEMVDLRGLWAMF